MLPNLLADEPSQCRDAINKRFVRYNNVMRHSCFLKLLWVFLPMVIFSCTDDDHFSSSAQFQLSFSTDTVKIDTVFSRVPSATKTFWVYNRSGEGIRCESVRLAQGNQTGFRVNVDGTYLGASQGYQVSNVEIRDKDSIRVFVELTSPVNNLDSPQPLADDLVFSLESGVQQKVRLTAWTWDAQMVNDWHVTADTTIATSKPIVVYGGITVEDNATLTISEGTTLYFHENAGLNVYGRLLVDGSAEKNVVFRGDRIDRMFDYLPYDRVSGQWQGIHFYEQSYGNIVNYADIHSAYNGVVCDSSAVDKLKLQMFSSVVHNCQGYGLIATHSVVDLVNSQVSNTLNDCVALFGGVGRIWHCTLAQFYPYDANRGAALRFGNVNGDKVYPLYDFNCVNSIVTGYADDVVMGEADTSAVYKFSFDHCLLRTPAIDDTVNIKEVIWEDPKDTVSCGYKQFVNIDTDNLIYDFRLKQNSPAIGKASNSLTLEYDRLGVRRDEEPDMGCYEYVAAGDDSPNEDN